MTLDLGKQQLIEGLSVIGDDDRPERFYVMPNQPRFRIDPDTKRPVFKFIKYKLPVDRPDGKKGGGFVVFDSEFVVSDDKMKKIRDALDAQVQKLGSRDAQGQPLKAEIDHIPFTSATAQLQLLDSSGVLVEKKDSPGKPSVFGSMVCPFTAELTAEGATVLEAAMKGSGGVAQVAYDLHFPATFPPISGSVWLDAVKFYSFYQSVDKSGGSWDSSDNTENDTMRESFINSSSGGVFLNFDSLGFIQDADVRKKIQDEVSNWGWSQIDQAVKATVLPEIKPTEDRGDHGMEHIQKTQTNLQVASFRRYLTERMGLDFNTTQGGTLPNITDMGFKWEDYYVEIDANDPFFATIMASIAINADFERYGIDSVDVHCEYTKINPPTIKDFHFKKPDDIGKFDSDTKNGDMNWGYSFSVNYKDQSLPYQAGLVPTNKGHITINANDLGIVCVELKIGNVDFAKTPQVQVTITYPENDAQGQPVNQQFNFDKDKKSDLMLAVLLKPADQPCTYQVTYIMADGTQMVTDPVPSQSSTIFINSPLVMHTYSFLSEGDFSNDIDSVFLKYKYSDEKNKLEQDSDFLFTAKDRQKDWTIPIISHSKGTITYSGVISYKNHTTENFAGGPTEADLIEFGPPNQVIVSVLPDISLIDFAKVKLIKLNMEYKDPANKIDVKHEYVLKQGTTPQPWTFYARDPGLTSYMWSTTFYMNTNPPQIVQGTPAPSSDSDLVLMMPG
jgi:hypothetical protein